MNRLFRLISLTLLACATSAVASPADAQRIRKSWETTFETWSLEARAAATPEARAKVAAARPDITPSLQQMWDQIGSSLAEDWTLDPAAWFLRASSGVLTRNPNGTTSPTFAKEIEAIRKAVETHHLNSLKLTPMCMAMVTTHDPRALATLEKVQANHPNKEIQGVAALAAAMILKTFGDEGDIMRKRLTYLRKAIIQSSDVDLGGTPVSKLAEDELYIIRFLSKGRIAPDLEGVDCANRPLKLSNFKGTVILLMFWTSDMLDAEGTAQITTEIEKKFHDRPFVVIGVNNDTREKLRTLECDNIISWKNFSDPSNKLAVEYRVGTWPLVYVLDGERKIHYTGNPGSFAELTAQALLSETKAETKEP